MDGAERVEVNLSSEARAADGSKGSPESRAAKEFAALLWRKAFEDALAPSPLAGDILGGSQASQMYQSMFIEEIARRAAERGVGLRQRLEDRLAGSADSSQAKPEDIQR